MPGPELGAAAGPTVGSESWGSRDRLASVHVVSAPTGLNPGRLPGRGDLHVGLGIMRVQGGWSLGMQGGHEQREERQGLGLHAEVPGAMSQPETTHPPEDHTDSCKTASTPAPPAPSSRSPRTPSTPFPATCITCVHRGLLALPTCFPTWGPLLSFCLAVCFRPARLARLPLTRNVPRPLCTSHPFSPIHEASPLAFRQAFSKSGFSAVTRWTRRWPWHMTAGGPLTPRPQFPHP